MELVWPLGIPLPPGATASTSTTHTGWCIWLVALQPQNQIPAARRLDKQNPQASTAPSRGGGQALPTVRLKVEFREQVTTTINSAAKGRREGEVGGAVNKELFEDGEEDINQVGERLKM